MKKRFAVILILLVIASCGKSVKDESNKYDAGGHDWVKTASATAENIKKKEDDLNRFFRDNHVLCYTNKKGLIVFEAGNAFFSSIKPDRELIKDLTKVEAYIISFDRYSPVMESMVNSKGLSYGGFVPTNSLLVKGDLNRIKELPGIKYITPYQPFMKWSVSDGDPRKVRKFHVSLWSMTDEKGFLSNCIINHITVKNHSTKDLIVETEDARNLLFDERVMKVEKYHEPSVFTMDGAGVRNIVLNRLGLGGNGMPITVSVYDMGVDDSQSDLDGVLKGVFDAAGDGDTTEYTTHGTHISGIIAGRGNLSAGGTLGVNPQASILFFAMADSMTGLSVPSSMESLFNTSINRGSKIANLSWGTYADVRNGDYLTITKDIDQYVYEHPDFIVLTAVGNDGTSIASPATAKNVISIGALDGNVLASYSGRNGCDDGRIKPDFTVQGSSIYSLGLNNTYIAESGTSQATGLTTGIVSL